MRHSPVFAMWVIMIGVSTFAVATFADEDDRLPPGTHTVKVGGDKLAREAVVVVPKAVAKEMPLPVVMMFHGGGGQARSTMWETRWSDLAEREGFIVVFPEGTRDDPTRPSRFLGNGQTWNDGSKRPTLGAVRRKVDDVTYVTALLDRLQKTLPVDRRRVYATGFSNGGSMTFRLARQLSGRIAAAAPVAGVDWMPEHKPERSVPLLYITGSADPLNPMKGGEIRIGRKRYGTKPSMKEMMARWVKLHGCRDKPEVVYDKDGDTGVAYPTQDDTHPVVVYTLGGHGHHWPGGRSLLPEKLVGKNTSTLTANDVIWTFFKQHALPEADK